MTSLSGSASSPEAAAGTTTGMAVRPAGSVRVAEVSGVFWVLTTLVAGIGGVISDWLLLTLGPAALGIDLGILAVIFILQLSVRRYIPTVFWSTMLGVGIVGTVGADIFSFLLGVPSWMIAIGYAIVIAATFLLWNRSWRTVSVRSVTTRRQGTYYWLTVFFVFAFGTALVDMVAQDWRLGYLLTGILFAVLIILAAVARLRFGANPVLSFWIAFVITRPLGASFAFWFALTPPDGLGGGYILVGTVWVALVVAMVVYAEITRRRVHDEDSVRP